MIEHRPDPDELLAHIQQAEKQQARGKLKIFLGAAPGVGKTYTMLEEALQKRQEGVDVVVGVVETHGRKEVGILALGLEMIPLQIVCYRKKKLSEFNLEAALKRNPTLILLDEMAHTNAPGLLHTKRWQDIKEILDRGIDVYTTLNVQHLESLNDIVENITNVEVQETVPDSMLELADSVELIDLPPDDLLKRLHEGKVYLPAQAELAAQHFFRKGNLIALRELALRVVAEQVNAQALQHRRSHISDENVGLPEKLVVCVNAGTDSIKLIRVARRMAVNLHIEWIAVYVEASYLVLSEAQRHSALQNLRFAEQLGAETVVLNGFDIAKEIIGFARERHVTRILIGKHIRPRWKNLLFGNLVNKLVRQSGEIDIYIIQGAAEHHKSLQTPSGISSALSRPVKWSVYVIAPLAVLLVTAINLFLFPYLVPSNLIMLYLLVMVMITFRRAQTAHIQERHSAALYGLSRRLATSRGIDKILKIGVRYIAQIFDSQVLALLASNDHLTVRAGCRSQWTLTDKEKSVARWVYELGQNAGMGTQTLPSSNDLYLPLLASQGTVGVLKIHPADPERLLIPEQIHLLEACANQLALALEVDRLQEKSKTAEIEVEAAHLRTLLLSEISNDLQAPLAVITQLTSKLLHGKERIESSTKNLWLRNILKAAGQLQQLINNLLRITQPSRKKKIKYFPSEE